MYDKILLTTDGSELAEAAIPTALGLAKACGAELRCVAVVESPAMYPGPAGGGSWMDNNYYRELVSAVEAGAEEALDRVEAKASQLESKVSRSVRHGNVADEVLAEAKEWGADVIVISTHGRTGIGSLLLGSQAQRIVHGASCPVLLHRGGGSSS